MFFYANNSELNNPSQKVNNNSVKSLVNINNFGTNLLSNYIAPNFNNSAHHVAAQSNILHSSIQSNNQSVCNNFSVYHGSRNSSVIGSARAFNSVLMSHANKNPLIQLQPQLLRHSGLVPQPLDNNPGMYLINYRESSSNNQRNNEILIDNVNNNNNNNNTSSTFDESSSESGTNKKPCSERYELFFI